MEQLISASGAQYGMIVNSDGSIPISGIVSIGTSPGSQLTFPQDYHLALTYISSGTATGINTGSEISIVTRFIAGGTGSEVKTLTYSSNNLTAVGSWV